MHEHPRLLSSWQKDQSQCGVSMDLVKKLQRAYQEGRKQPENDEVPAALRLFVQDQSRYLQNRLTRYELALFARCKSECAKAENSAVHGDIQSACQSLATAQSVVERSNLSEEARVRCRTELAAVESHVDDCCRDFEHAKAKVLESMVLDEELETRFGYSLTHVHRIHLLNRLVTLEGRSGRLDQAVSLAASIFRYLEGTCEHVPLPGSWGRVHLITLSPGIVRFLTRQLTGEVAALLLRRTNDVVLRAVTTIVQGRRASAALNVWDPISVAWFDLKILSLQEGMTLPYLEACTEFLARGPGAAVLLWHLTALDAAIMCKAFQPNEGGIFTRTVVTDLLAMDNFPWALKAHWVKSLNSEPIK